MLFTARQVTRALLAGRHSFAGRFFRQPRKVAWVPLWPVTPSTTEWGYNVGAGPETWSRKYPEAGGRHQSPIDICTASVQSSTDLSHRPLTWSYGSQICKSILNTGCGWRVDVDGTESELSGGPLENNYELVQFHSHWGSSSCCGSEHTVDGKSFAGELHFVHWNKELYKTCPEAVSASKGLAVLGVFLEVGEENTEVEKLCQVLDGISYKDQRVDLPEDFDPTYLFPTDQSYWTYEGSLTTPPCYESVTWIVFKHPIIITEKQLECFRAMHCTCQRESCGDETLDDQVKHNFRPPQALNDRCIKECIYC